MSMSFSRSLFVRLLWLLCFFFFKQKTAYEIRLSLVGSEMCIRDTSGSTGRPSEVLVSSAALRASARATAAHLGAEGHWLLALPTDRVAGAMVVVRSRLAETALTGVGPGRFTAEAFTAAAARLPSAGPRFTSLVPTQLSRVLESPQGADVLASFAAVLVGGAALGFEVPANIVRTYGLTETAGGCVYNGVPIGDTSVRLRPDGRIR